MKSLYRSAISLILSSPFISVIALAQPTEPNSAGIDKAARLLTAVHNVLGAVYYLIIGAGGAVVVLMIVVGGIQYISNQQDTAKKTIISAIIGAVIIILSSATIAILQNFLAGATANLTNGS